VEKNRISKDRIRAIISGFSKKSILVVGDSMIDKYIWGDVRRISPESPVPVVQVESKSERLGGSANVVQNLSSLGVTPYLVSLCGNDPECDQLFSMLEGIGCSTKSMCQSSRRPTTTKTRILAGHQQIVRVDQEVVADVSEEECNTLWQNAGALLSKVQAVIISDYAKGVVSQPFIGKLLKKCKSMDKFVAIDPKERHFNLYKGMSIMTPNLKEAHVALGIPYRNCSNEEIMALGWKIVDKFNLHYLLITLSERGMALFEQKGRVYTHLPTVAQKVFDVTGAGDTVISTYCAAITSHASPLEAAFISNHAAGLTVAELGTACVSPEALLKACFQTPLVTNAC
jgi:D-beta-D-heptose 7-phosphate kinase/D-beta-D-heptose 1-phosphate adenosyltransferase